MLVVLGFRIRMEHVEFSAAGTGLGPAGFLCQSSSHYSGYKLLKGGYIRDNVGEYSRDY